MNKLLLATDGSPSAKKAAETVKGFLTAYPQLEIVIITVGYNALIYDAATFTTSTFYEEINRQEDEFAEQLKQECLETFKPWKERVRFVHVKGYPSNEICKLADKEQVDMIVVGSHGKSAVDRVLLGSVSHAVLNHAKTSVLVIK